MQFMQILSRTKQLVVGLVLALALGGAAVAGVHGLAEKNPPATFKLADANEGPAKVTFAPIVKKTLPAVVNISSSKVVKTPRGNGKMPMDQLFQQFFGEQG